MNDNPNREYGLFPSSNLTENTNFTFINILPDSEEQKAEGVQESEGDLPREER
jgi:hypothetical protein